MLFLSCRRLDNINSLSSLVDLGSSKAYVRSERICCLTLLSVQNLFSVVIIKTQCKCHLVCFKLFESYELFHVSLCALMFWVNGSVGWILSIVNIVIEPSFLQYAKLIPACFRYSDAQSLREKCATPILKQVISW